LGLPFGFEVIAKLVEFFRVFVREDNGGGAKAVTESVHFAGLFSLGSLWAGRL
jgi:hypothetical protein